MKRNRIKLLVSLSAVLCIFLIGGTIAYFSDRESVGNVFAMGTYNGELNEVFAPPENWQPGVKTEKKVKISNTGTVDFVAAARFDENCIRRDDVISRQYNSEDGTFTDVTVARAGEELPVVFTDEEGILQEVGVKQFGSQVVFYEENTDPADYAGKWVGFRDVTDRKHVVCYFLYAGIISAKEDSPYILESVTMNPLLESTVSRSHQILYYDKEAQQNVQSFSYDVSEYGYDSAHYSIYIQSKTVQATREAIAGELAGDNEMVPAKFTDLLKYVQGLCSK